MINLEKDNKIYVRRDRFQRIVERRVNKILENLDSLGKCSNKRNYEYSQDDVNKIFREIQRKLRETKQMFQGKTNKNMRFKL